MVGQRTFLKQMKVDSLKALDDYIWEKAKSIRFFSYGSNMNEIKFKRDMKGTIGLVNKTTVTLNGFKRTLTNKSVRHGVAFSICPSPIDRVEGICHDIPIPLLEIFLEKEGVLNPDNPSYRIIKVSIPDQDASVLSLHGLKPILIEELSFEKAKLALNYVKVSIQGAKCCDVEYTDMIEAERNLEDIIRKKRIQAT